MRVCRGTDSFGGPWGESTIGRFSEGPFFFYVGKIPGQIALKNAFDAIWGVSYRKSKSGSYSLTS